MIQQTLNPSYGVDPIFSPSSIRHCSNLLFERALRDSLSHFSLDGRKLDELVGDVVTRADLRTAPLHTQWRNFDFGGVERISQLDSQLSNQLADPIDRAKSRLDLLFLNEALETGGNGSWRYFDSVSGHFISRTEGLATATLRLFQNGFFSSDTHQPCRVDAQRLRAISAEEFRCALQISADNPIAGGVESRLDRLSLFAFYLEAHREFQVDSSVRPGNILNAFSPTGAQPIEPLFSFLAQSLTHIWPGNIHEGKALGDAWRHSALDDDATVKGIVPIHRITQWLHYAIEPVMREFCQGTLQTETLTGLPGYRNSGLLIDRGVLVARDAELAKRTLHLGDEPIVELRALTIGAMDHVLKQVREAASMDSASLPMAKLNGIFWRAGREIAAAVRPDGSPPFKVMDQGVPF